MTTTAQAYRQRADRALAAVAHLNAAADARLAAERHEVGCALNALVAVVRDHYPTAATVSIAQQDDADWFYVDLVQDDHGEDLWEDEDADRSCGLGMDLDQMNPCAHLTESARHLWSSRARQSSVAPWRWEFDLNFLDAVALGIEL